MNPAGATMNHSPTAVWQAMPEDVQEALVLSSTGTVRLHVLSSLLADAAVNPPAGPWTPSGLTRELAAELAFASWEYAPLNSLAAATLMSHAHAFGPERASALETARAIAMLPTFEAQDLIGFHRIRGAEEIAEGKTTLRQKERAHPRSTAWAEAAVDMCLHNNEGEWLNHFLEKKAHIPPLLKLLVKTDLLFAGGEYEKAATNYLSLFTALGMSLLLKRAADCHRRLGNRDEALRLMLRAFALRPWDASLILCLGSLARGHDLPGSPPPGRGVVLLYSWNHAADLDQAIEALAASELYGTPILCLDNGSTDDTPSVTRKWAGVLGERFRLITLPVNVGAPAARNWLLAEKEAREADWVVYLDDDAMVPADWLGFFGTSMRAYPGAGIFGCRINDMGSPLTRQCADVFVENPALTSESPIIYRHIKPVVYSSSEPDFGEFCYLRPCLSVTGCCHLLTRANLEAVGGFDIRFSPSQFDDFERDIRSALKGQQHVYNGYLSVQHKKCSGFATHLTAWSRANISGNTLKLAGTYDVRELTDFSRRVVHTALKDILERIRLWAAP